jgi:transposase, IS6 family
MAAKVGFITGTSRGFGREWAIAGSVAPVEDRIGQAWLMRRRPRRVSASRSNFSGFRFPPDVIMVAVRWYLRYGLSRDVEELLAERVYRAIDQFGQVIDVLVSEKRDLAATRRFFTRALNTTRVTPVEVITDKAAVYPQVLDELAPGAWHHTEQYSNNRIETDHGRLKSRLRPMRGLKRLRSARVISAGHAFIQNTAADTTNSAPRNPRHCG